MPDRRSPALKMMTFFQASVIAMTLALPGRTTLRGEDAEASLRIPPASGMPGEEVAVEFRATFPEPLFEFTIHFELPEDFGRFIRSDIRGTASAHAAPRGIISIPNYPKGGSMIGIRFNTQNDYEPLQPGYDLLLIKAIFLIRADAAPGDHPIHVIRATLGAPYPTAHTVKCTVQGDGVFTVKPPSGPRPVGDLSCYQNGLDVNLTWTLSESYESIRIRRSDGFQITLSGHRLSYVDRPPPGPVAYRVTAIRGSSESIPASCGLLVQAPRPPPVADLTCTPLDGMVSLRWKNGAAYDGITVFRNGTVLAILEGGAKLYDDPFSTDLFTVYTVRARSEGVETLPATCKLNEMSGAFIYRAEEVRGEPGTIDLPVRILATNPREALGMQIGIRIDPAHVRIRELSLLCTASEAAGYDLFQYQTDLLEKGQTSCGILFDTMPPFEEILPTGADQHVLTVYVEVLPDAPRRAAVPVEIGMFGNPPLKSLFSVLIDGEATTILSENHPGAILVGLSPVPEVQDARGEMKGDGSSDRGAILLTWRNAAEYSSIWIEKDEMALEGISGDAMSYEDPDPGPGIHRYGISGIQGEYRSFPVVVTVYPRDVPGTFLRGDVNSDLGLDITDVYSLLAHLFLDGEQPSCLDAADADDSGEIDITDAIAILYYLFFSPEPLPAPGTETPWFDPTPDDLTCG